MPSETQRQTATGTSSTVSPLEEIQLRQEQEAAEAVKNRAGLSRLGQMLGLESIDRNLRSEDQIADFHQREMERELFGRAPDRNAAGQEEGEMRIMSGGDVHIAPQERPQPMAAQPNGGLKHLLPWLIAALAGGWLANDYLDGSPHEDKDTNTQYELRLDGDP